MLWHNKKAILYYRVSSEEQGHNNSLPDQSERLTKFCQLMSITVVKTFQDDYSAKTFNRPGWRDLLDHIKRNRNKADLLLFTNWSRFSRAENMGETYMEIEKLIKLGISPQAVEQPLDLDIPENRLVLSFYIAAPAVENMRRRDNTTGGMRKSLSDGRYCMAAPFGYDNSREPGNPKKPILTINEPQAVVVRQIFQEFLQGKSIKEIRENARSKGYTVRGNSAIQKTLNNPLYAGIVKVFAHKGEGEKYVMGIHQPIIQADTYWTAVYKFKNESAPKPKQYNDRLPLRGIINCDSCGKLLTGSRSKGRHGGYWWYYRCLSCKGENYSAKKAHEELSTLLDSLSLNQSEIDSFISEVDKEVKVQLCEEQSELFTLKRKLREAEERLTSLEEKYIANQVSFQTYERHYPELKNNVSVIREKMELLSVDKEDLLTLYHKTLPKLMNMNFLYEGLTLNNKQEFLRLVFTGGLIKLKESYRTPHINSLFSMKPAIGAGLEVVQNMHESEKFAELPSSRREGSEIEPLLRFLWRVAA